MRHKKQTGWAFMGMALLVLIAGDFVSGVISLLFTFGAMLIGGIGIFLASDDRE